MVELIASIVMVRTVDGRKLITVGQIFANYFKDGMAIDVVYLIVLIADVFGNVGWVGLVILLKLP